MPGLPEGGGRRPWETRGPFGRSKQRKGARVGDRRRVERHALWERITDNPGFSRTCGRRIDCVESSGVEDRGAPFRDGSVERGDRVCFWVRLVVRGPDEVPSEGDELAVARQARICGIKPLPRLQQRTQLFGRECTKSGRLERCGDHVQEAGIGYGAGQRGRQWRCEHRAMALMADAPRLKACHCLVCGHRRRGAGVEIVPTAWSQQRFAVDVLGELRAHTSTAAQERDVSVQRIGPGSHVDNRLAFAADCGGSMERRGRERRRYVGNLGPWRSICQWPECTGERRIQNGSGGASSSSSLGRSPGSASRNATSSAFASSVSARRVSVPSVWP